MHENISLGHRHPLTAEAQLRARAEGVDDVDNQAMRGCPKRQRPCGHQESHNMEEVGQVSGDIQRVVEGQHEHVPGQDGDVIPHQVLLQRWCG